VLQHLLPSRTSINARKKGLAAKGPGGSVREKELVSSRRGGGKGTHTQQERKTFHLEISWQTKRKLELTKERESRRFQPLAAAVWLSMKPPVHAPPGFDGENLPDSLSGAFFGKEGMGTSP
jgi:hypothetical protein